MNTDTFKNNKLVMGIIAVIIVIILIFVWNPFKGSSSSTTSSTATTTKSSTTTAIALVTSSVSSNTTLSSGVSTGTDTSSSVASSTTATSSTAGKFTAADIATHNSSTSCYVTFKNVVYDVTKYIPSHPGGSKILQSCGKDLSLYNSTHKGGQYDSAAVKAVLDKYIIGSM